MSFDTDLGHDLIKDARKRYDDRLHQENTKLSFNIQIFNKINRGGILKKTLNVVLADRDKTTFMINFAAHTLRQGKSVVYFTLRMTKEDIAKKLKANILDTPISKLHNIDAVNYDEEMDTIRKTTSGEIAIKEYLPTHPHCGDFRIFLDELRIKRKITPDLVIMDCLDVCASQKNKNKEDSEAYMKSIAGEIRAMAVEYNVAVLSAAQLSRSSITISDPKLEDTDESYGIACICDVMWALIPNESPESENHILVKQLKNRYNNTNYYKKFIMKIDRDKMQFSDAEQSARKNIPDAGYGDDD